MAEVQTTFITKKTYKYIWLPGPCEVVVISE